MEVNQDTRRMTDDWSRNAPEMLVQSAQGVDARMVGTIAAGSVVIGVASATVDKGFDVTSATIPMVVAVLLYVGVLVSAVICLWPSKYRRPTNPEALKAYWPYEPERVLQWHSELVLNSYRINLRIHGKKVKMLYLGLAALVGETSMIIVWMFLETFN